MRNSRPTKSRWAGTTDEPSRAFTDDNWRKKAPTDNVAPSRDERSAPAQLAPQRPKPTYIAQPVTSSAWGAAPEPTAGESELTPGDWLTPGEMALMAAAMPKHEEAPPIYEEEESHKLEPLLPSQALPIKMPSMPSSDQRVPILSQPMDQAAAGPMGGTWAFIANAPRSVVTRPAPLAHGNLPLPAAVSSDMRDPLPGEKKPQKQQPQQQTSSKPKTGKPMSLSDLIAPQLKPKQSKQSKPSQKELRNKAAAAATRAESALGTGGNRLAKEGAIKMRGKEREVKKAKKPSKVKKLILAERQTKQRSTEIEQIANQLSQLQEFASHGICLPQTGWDSELQQLEDQVSTLTQTMQKEVGTLEEELQELGQDADAQADDLLAEWGEAGMLERKKRTQQLQDSLSKKMLWRNADDLTIAKLRVQAMQRSIVRADKGSTLSSTRQLLEAMQQRCNTEQLRQIRDQFDLPGVPEEPVPEVPAADVGESILLGADLSSQQFAMMNVHSAVFIPTPPVNSSLSMNTAVFVPQAKKKAPDEPAAIKAGWKAGAKVIREYVDQVIDANLDTAVTELLNQLAKFQTKLFEQDPVKAAQKRRFQCGLREVMKSAKRGKLKLVVIAPNIDKIEADGGLDDMVGEVVAAARESGTPIAFALNRMRLGKAVSNRHKISAIGVINPDGAYTEYKQVLQLIDEAKAKWHASKPR